MVMAATISHFFLLLLPLISTTAAATSSDPLPNFPAILIFGDSTVDTGNNNYVLALLRADHPPYGQNFPGNVATGRFSNGKLIPDAVASMFGLKETVPPFLQPNISDDDIKTGVSFASAGSGYDDLTPLISKAIPVSRQPGIFRSYIERLKCVVGEKEAQRIVNEALILVSSGTNDFVFNFYDIPSRQLEYDVAGYQDFLQNKLQILVKEVYELGGRNMIIAGLPPIGCLPIQMTLKISFQRMCQENQNLDAQSYNDKLEKLLPNMMTSLRGSKILYADIYTPLMDMMTNPQKYGFVETTLGCCGSGELEVGPLCNSASFLCANASEYLFWDSIHPSGSAYSYIVDAVKNQLLHDFLNLPPTN